MDGGWFSLGTTTQTWQLTSIDFNGYIAHEIDALGGEHSPFKRVQRVWLSRMDGELSHFGSVSGGRRWTDIFFGPFF